jgi:hypothetical protein
MTNLLCKNGRCTVRRLCGRAKHFFAAAIRHNQLTENPFDGMKCSFVETRDRDCFVTE